MMHKTIVQCQNMPVDVGKVDESNSSSDQTIEQSRSMNRVANVVKLSSGEFE